MKNSRERVLTQKNLSFETATIDGHMRLIVLEPVGTAGVAPAGDLGPL